MILSYRTMKYKSPILGNISFFYLMSQSQSFLWWAEYHKKDSIMKKYHSFIKSLKFSVMIFVNQRRRRKWNERICDRNAEADEVLWRTDCCKGNRSSCKKGWDLRAARKEWGREDDIDDLGEGAGGAGILKGLGHDATELEWSLEHALKLVG